MGDEQNADDAKEKGADGQPPASKLPTWLADGAWRKWIIRVVVVILFAASLAFALSATAPPKAELPAVALGQEVVYKLELGLAAFFGGLLVLTPLVQGVVNGRLPSEITARGAKFDPEDVADSLRKAQERIEKIEATVESGSAAEILSRVDLADLRKEVATLREELETTERRPFFRSRR